MKRYITLFIFISLLLAGCSLNNNQSNQNPSNPSAKKDIQVASPETKNIKPIAEHKDESSLKEKNYNKANYAPVEEVNKIQSEAKSTNTEQKIKDKPLSNTKSDNNTNSTPAEEISKVESEYQKYSQFLRINDKVTKFIKEDIDLDGKEEIVIAFGGYDDQVHILRADGNSLQELGQLNVIYMIYDVRLVQMQGKNQKYIEADVTNGSQLSGFALYEVVKDKVSQIAYSASATGAGEDYLTSSAKNEIYDGYIQNRYSYDVMHFPTLRYYKWNGQKFEFVSSDVDMGDYPDKLEGVAYEFLKLNSLGDEDRNSKNVVDRLNELNISNKMLNINKIDLDSWHEVFQTDDDIIDFAEENGSSAKVNSPFGISFSLTKNNNKWQITDMNGDMVIEKIQQ